MARDDRMIRDEGPGNRQASEIVSEHSENSVSLSEPCNFHVRSRVMMGEFFQGMEIKKNNENNELMIKN